MEKGSKNTYRYLHPYLITNPEQTTAHQQEDFNIMGRERHIPARAIRVYFIRANNPILNRNNGKYNLPHIWHRVLFTTLELKVKTDKNLKHTTLHQYHLQQKVVPNIFLQI